MIENIATGVVLGLAGVTIAFWFTMFMELLWQTA